MGFFSHHFRNQAGPTASQGPDFAYYEYKYLVQHECLTQVYDLLQEFYGDSDPYPSGIVDSIYYDTYEETCLSQCVNGDADKVKFRIRGYGDGTYTQQHQKIKTLSGVAKYKARLENVRAKDEKAPEWTDLQPVEKSLFAANAIAHHSRNFGYLVPSIRVQYLRHRFRSYSDRITLDTNIEVFAQQNGLPRSLSYAQLPHHVLEIKTRRLRPNLPFIGLVKLQQVSFSKFMLGIDLLNA